MSLIGLDNIGTALLYNLPLEPVWMVGGQEGMIKDAAMTLASAKKGVTPAHI